MRHHEYTPFPLLLLLLLLFLLVRLALGLCSTPPSPPLDPTSPQPSLLDRGWLYNYRRQRRSSAGSKIVSGLKNLGRSRSRPQSADGAKAGSVGFDERDEEDDDDEDGEDPGPEEDDADDADDVDLTEWDVSRSSKRTTDGR